MHTIKTANVKNYNLITINKKLNNSQSYNLPFLKLVVDIVMTITILHFNKMQEKS